MSGILPEKSGCSFPSVTIRTPCSTWGREPQKDSDMGNVLKMHGRGNAADPQRLPDSELQLKEALDKIMYDFKGSKEDFLGVVADWLDEQANS